MRDPYHCPYCDQRSTRRWNLDVHIKRKHGGLLGRSSDRSMANNLHSQSIHLRNATVADDIDNTFYSRSLPQQAVLGTSHHSANPIYPPVDVPQTFANPTYTQIMDVQSYGTGLSQGAIHKIQELKLLVNKYPQFHAIDAGEIIKWAIYCSSNHDNKFLDDMLEQLRTIDSLAQFR